MQNSGIGFFGLLTILFIGLKLTGTIAWSWLWVLAPLWLPLALILAVLLAIFLCWLAFHLLGALWKKVRPAKPRRA